MAAEEDLDELLLAVTRKKDDAAKESDESSERIYEGDEESSDGGNEDLMEIGDSDEDRRGSGGGKRGGGGKKKGGKVVKGGGKRKRQGEDDDDDDWRDDDDDDDEGRDGENDEEESSSEDDEPSEFEDEFREDLTRDDEDSLALSKMTELDREKLIAERSDRRTQKRMEWELKHSLKAQSRSRKRMEKAKKQKAKHRDGRRDRGSQGYKKDAMAKFAADKAKKKKAKSGVGSDAGSDLPLEASSGDEREMDVELDSEGPPLRFDDLVVAGTRETTPLYVRRDTLAKWISEACFDRLVTGLFVKISVGENPEAPGIQVYRLCRIKKVVETAISRRVVSTTDRFQKKMAEQVLLLETMTRSSRDDHLQLVVTQRFGTWILLCEEEFQRWVRQMDEDSMPLPSRAEIDKKVKQVRQILSGEIKATEEEERKHQENFEKVNPERINRLAKRKELKIKLEAAKLKKSEDEIAELEVRLRHLEEVDEKLKTMMEEKKSRPTISNSSALFRKKAMENKAKNERRDKLAAMRRIEGDEENKSFQRLEASGQSYFSIRKKKSPLPPPRISKPIDTLRMDSTGGGDSGKRQPPISKRFDITTPGIEEIDAYWAESKDKIKRRHLPPSLDCRSVPLPPAAPLPANVISFKDFQRQMGT